MAKTRRKHRGAKQIPSQPHIPPVQESVKPGNNFYKYVNGNWLRHVNMPPYMSSYGVSEEIEAQINNELLTILESSRTSVRTNPDKILLNTTYLLGTLTESALNSHNQDLNVKFLKNLVSTLRCIRDKNDLGSVLGEFVKYRIKCVLGCIVVPAESQTDTLRLTLVPGDLGLPDPSYYDEPQSRIMNAYIKLLTKLGEEFDVLGLETSISMEFVAANAIFKSRQDTEILMTGEELERTYKHIPWHSFIQSAFNWSPVEFRNKKILVFSKSWLSSLNKWMNGLQIEQWKLWLSSLVILHFLPLLPPPYDDYEFELYGHRMRGQSEKLPQKQLALRLSQQWLSGSLGYMFVKNYVPSEIKTSALSIAKEIQKVAEERAGQIDWLESKTKHIAQQKIRNIFLGVAYPSSITKDKIIKLNPECLLENIIRLSQSDFQEDIEKIDTKLNRTKWDDHVFSVNAYYYNEGNRLILPAGILRWPFFHTQASDGWNFGGLGATIGHEICHAFDNDGKDYDETGNKNPWWNKNEIDNYKEKTKALIKLYNRSEYFGHHLNGHLTLSENIADLGGLAIALSALKKRLDSSGVSYEKRMREICNFFKSFAVSWRTKEKKEKALQSLFMDVHAPPSTRVNNIVGQFDDWYECFNVLPGDELYIAPKDRIRIF
jgi:putative endopeptidase